MGMLFGTFNFNTIVTIRGSSLFYWGYMTIVSLILLNMMLAIVMGTYKAMSKDGYQGEINVLLATRISYIYRYPWQFLIKHLKAFSKYVVRQMGCGKDGHSMEMESSKLSHSDVIVNGKFRPPVLLMVLKKKLKDDGAYTSTTMLTPTLLRGFFPYCAVSDKEMIDTFEFLRQGLLLNEAVTKQSPTKKFESEKAKTSRVAELQQNLAVLLEQIINDCQWDAITCLL